MEAIIVALITALGVGIWPAILARRAVRDTALTKEIVTGNGQGNVAEMLSAVLHWQQKHDFIHADLERTINAKEPHHPEAGSGSRSVRS